MAEQPQASGHWPTQLDQDAQETREWLDALSAVIDKEGP